MFVKKYYNFSKHNRSDMKLYRTWYDMKRRCTDPRRADYERYGGNGIKVCEEWMNFQNFLDWSKENGYAPSLTIDRIDREGNYEPTNCRWADIYTQANNRKNNHWIEYCGETHTMKEWSDKLNISYYALRDRLNRGWDVEKALTTPVGEGGRQ